MNIYKSFLFTLLMSVSSILFGQEEPRDSMDDKIEVYRAQFFTRELNLSSEEAQDFWPVYNAYRDELHRVRKQRRGRHLHPDGVEKLEQMTDAEIQKMLEKELNEQQQLVDLRKKYYQKFKEVLPIKKVALLYRAEIEFQRRLIRKLGNRKPSGRR